jgi:hypothetical protein
MLRRIYTHDLTVFENGDSETRDNPMRRGTELPNGDLCGRKSLQNIIGVIKL